jgi:hypothetical protein
MIQVLFSKKCVTYVAHSDLRKSSLVATSAVKVSIRIAYLVPKIQHKQIKTAGFAITASFVKNVTAQNNGRDLYCAQYATKQITIGVCNLNLSKCLNAVGNAPTASSAELVEQKSSSVLKILKTKLILIRIKSTH